MTRLVARAEAYETIYDAFEQINFAAFDYNTIKSSLIDYLKLYHKEDFNDYIESSEFIAILEIFAYVTELQIYRLDVNANENFITQAQRKQSVLRLAKFLSYNVSRNIAARGLVKIQNISTSEDIFDNNGNNLANVTIVWNDPNNPNWKEQFILVMNRVLKQTFGSVAPTERIQIDDVLFELYEWENISFNHGVFPYSTTVSGESVPMELTPVSLVTTGPEEKRPERSSAFSLLYGSDGLGDSSDTTGFFLFTKQGALSYQTNTFDGVTPNQTLIVPTRNINDTDVWVNAIDPETGETLDDGAEASRKTGEWEEVDLAHAQNVIFNTNPSRNKYEIETLEDDNIKIIFGDGEFADIPSGDLDIWIRTSINKVITIPKNTIVNQASNFNYVGLAGNVQTFKFAFSLINSLQNSSASEDIEHVRRTAPAVYYTQDRMVNGRDYNTFMLQDTTILKLRTLNRTFSGDSKYLHWHEPKENYESVKLFGNDLALFYKSGESTNNVYNEPSASTVFNNNVQPLLSSNDFFTIMTTSGVLPGDVRKEFTEAETLTIVQAMEDAAASSPQTLHLFYSIELDEWVYVLKNPNDDDFSNDLPFSNVGYDVDQVLYDISNPWNGLILSGQGMIIIEVSGLDWTISHKLKRIISQSIETRFWNSNDANRILSFDTLLSNQDEIIVLDANKNDKRDDMLEQNWHYNVIGPELVESTIPTNGLIDIHSLNIMPIDTTEDNIPDNIELDGIISPTFDILQNEEFTLPFSVTFKDISTAATFDYFVVGTGYTPTPNPDDIIISVQELNVGDASLTVVEYVYFQKDIIDDTTQEFNWVPKPVTSTNIQTYLDDEGSLEDEWKREIGRFPFNFLWMHRTPRLNLVDPAQTNIMDAYIVTRSYYTNVLNWLDDTVTEVPVPPTSLSLRTEYSSMLDSKMISDTMILHSGNFKILFGDKAIDELKAKFTVIRKDTSVLTNNQVKVKVVGIIKEFFDVNSWEFGETFFFTELSAKIHNEMIADIKSIVLVPLFTDNLFGDIFMVNAREDEIFQPHITVNNIEIVESYNPEVIKQLN